MNQILECVPNFSEGRDLSVIEKLCDCFRGKPGVRLLDYTWDQDHNRCVLTIIGEPEPLRDAVVESIGRAVELIDMTKHQGQHPRMGCVDVVPFIPIRNTTVGDADRIAKETAQLASQRFGQPFFLYEKSATAPHRANLADVRKGQFEGMAEKVQQDEWAPDFGGRRINPTAGVVAVGCRMPLVAFNINLSTSDVSIASKIAKIIRRSSGGLDCVKALGIMLEDRNIAQVSINMTDFSRTPLYRVLEFVRFEAARYGVQVIGTEIIGLTPMRALVDCAEYYLQIENFNADKQVLENYIQ